MSSFEAISSKCALQALQREMSNFQPEGCIKGSTRNAYLVKFIILDQRCSCTEVGLVWSFSSSLLPVTVSSHLELHDWYLVSEHGLKPPLLLVTL